VFSYRRKCEKQSVAKKAHNINQYCGDCDVVYVHKISFFSLHVMALVFKCFDGMEEVATDGVAFTEVKSNGIRRSSEPRHDYIASL